MMVGGISLLGSSVVDPHTSPCLCLDVLSTQPAGKKHFLRPGSLELSTCFVNKRLPAKASSCSRRRRRRGLVVVNELGGQYDDNFHDVKAQIFNLFTYKAVRTVMNQLYEMNPTEYRWFYDFVTINKPTDAKRFIRVLQKEKHELAERVMVTRLHLYGKWVKKLDHAEMYKDLSDQNLQLMRERLMETVVWPSDDTNTEKIG